ncbi:MAG: hypothetical protein JJU05_17395 [Verrucomicrobia bacterium]|nr:hypothetical protein [Verrucomicrobiota bacterium]
MNPTRTTQLSPDKLSKRGSTLTVVLIIMMLTAFMAASLLSLGSHEKDFTYRRIADVEGRHVLESAVEIAMAELQQHFREAQSVTNNIPTVTLPAPLVTQLVGNTRYVTGVRITNITNRQFRDQVFVDALDPDTMLDPHRGSYVNISEWTIQAEADVNYRGQTRQIRAAQSFQVRESPFFTHAILYNMDLEFHPGPAMIINGPVHSNGRIWAVAQTSLHFLDRVSATEGIHIGGMMEGQQENWSNGYLDNQDGQKVWFNTGGRSPAGAQTNDAHNRRFANLWDRSGNNKRAASYFDARSEDSGKLFDELGFTGMTEFLANWFSGNVAMGSLEAPIIRSQFIPNYVADDGNGNRLNFGYALVEPLMRKTDHLGQPNPYYKGMGELEKFSYKAGLTFDVKYLPDFERSTLTDDQRHWRQLWEPGYSPRPLPHYAQAFSSFANGVLNGQAGYAVQGSNSASVTVGNHTNHVPAYQNGAVEHDESIKFVQMSPGGNADTGFTNKAFNPLTGNDVYFSFVLDIGNAGNNTDFQFGLTNQDQFNTLPGVQFHYRKQTSDSYTSTQIGSNLLSGTHRAETNINGYLSNRDTVLIVGRLYKTTSNGNFNRAEFFVNPSTLERPGTGWESAQFDTGISEVNRLFFKANKNAFRIADIRIGTEYRQVVGKYEGLTDYWVIPQKVRRSNAFDLDTTDMTVFEGPSTLPDFDTQANTSLLVDHDPVYIREWPAEDDPFSFHDVFRARIYDEASDGRPVPNGGLYDKRDLKPQDLIAMDMGAFKTGIVETSELDRFRMPLTDGNTLLTYNPANEFNGVAYFQFPVPGNRTADLDADEDPRNFLAGRNRPDNILVARNNFRFFRTERVNNQNQVRRDDYTSLSLFIHNAKEIPNPAYNINREPGFTLATNARTYLKGSYNADGVASTGSLTEGDGLPEHDALAAVAADTVTFLSENFRSERSKDSSLPGATFTEVNAAVMSGILPTNTNDLDSRYTPRHDYPISGGSHNYHRFLESFSNITFRYRGSMVAFYESELARSPQEQQGNTWYNAPRREYGFYEVFGTGAQPPGTPMARTYFKMDFRFE